MNDLSVDVARRRYIGGGIIAAVLGCDPRRTPFDAWVSLTSADPPAPIHPSLARFFRNRRLLEPNVVRRLREEFGIRATKMSMDREPNRYDDAEFPWAKAEIDFEFEVTRRFREHIDLITWADAADRKFFLDLPLGMPLNGEVKTLHPFSARALWDRGGETLLVEHEAQVSWGLGVTRRVAAIVAVLIGVDDLICFPVVSDQTTINLMRSVAKNFWEKNVLGRIPPEAKNVDDVRKLYMRHRGAPVDLDAATQIALSEIFELRAANTANDAQIADREWILMNHVRRAWGMPNVEGIIGTKEAKDQAWKAAIAEMPNENAAFVWGGVPIATWKNQETERIDVDRLRLEHPGIAENLTTRSRSRVLRAVKPKKGKS